MKCCRNVINSLIAGRSVAKSFSIFRLEITAASKEMSLSWTVEARLHFDQNATRLPYAWNYLTRSFLWLKFAISSARGSDRSVPREARMQRS